MPRRYHIRDFLHMVASSELTVPTNVNAAQPLNGDVYKIDLGGDVSWLQSVEADPPVIVFSKVNFIAFYVALPLLITITPHRRIARKCARVLACASVC